MAGPPPTLVYLGTMDSDHTPHNHQHCIRSALKAADDVCAQSGSRLTPLRAQVLEALWGSHKAQGAYDLLDALNRKAKKKLAPLSVYRALDFLVAEGLAHRIESLNAYVGCPHPSKAHALQFLVCSDCHMVTELEEDKISRPLKSSAAAHGFTPARTVVEVIGLCRACAA